MTEHGVEVEAVAVAVAVGAVMLLCCDPAVAAVPVLHPAVPVAVTRSSSPLDGVQSSVTGAEASVGVSVGVSEGV